MVSSKDVAKAAGVSQPTVSRVLNNPDSVMPEKRERVQKAMQQLGYKPNLLARNLVAKSTRTIALITGSLMNDFFVETTDSIVNYAASRNYKTIIYAEHTGGSTHDVLVSAMGYQVDGILMSSIKLDDPCLSTLESSGVPYMLFNRRPRQGGNYVVLDNAGAGARMAEHLLSEGHRNIAYVTSRPDISTRHERLIGFQHAMLEAGTPMNPELLVITDPESPAVRSQIRRLMQSEPRPSAIVCAMDELALLCLDELLAIGLRVPEDVCLAGFDDIAMSAHRAIQLTSIGMHAHDMGGIAALMLLDWVESGSKPDKPLQIVLPPELIIRKSTRRSL